LATHRSRRVALVVLGLGALAWPPGRVVAQGAPDPPTTVAASPTIAPASPAASGAPAGSAAASGRMWFVPVPTGCTVPDLPDVVFVGTVLDKGTPAGVPKTTANQTARFRLDQGRAGALDRFTYNGVIDIRYGLDAKDLEKGEQYLVGASVDTSTGVLTSKIRETEPAFGGDDVIAASQEDLKCPTLTDPVRTLHTDGTPVDAGILQPLLSSKGRLLRAILLPLLIVLGIVFALVALRWLITGAGKGVASVVRTASEPHEVRAAMRSRPNVNPDLKPERNPDLEDAHRH
jgi:hypothetical protein